VITETTYCTRCGKALADSDQFCSKCGTQRAEDADDATDDDSEADETRMGERSASQRVRNAIITLLILGIIGAYGFEALGNAVDVTAECGPFYQPCRLTINNHGIWPAHFTGDVSVDGTVVQTSGAGLAGPFGSGTINLYSSDGTALHTMKTVSYTAGVVPFPDIGSGLLTMQGQ
jgi:zinc-ribbon domain